MRPMIAVAPLTAGGWRMTRPYLHCLEQAGGAPIVLPLTDNPEVLDVILKDCSGLVITGGQDVAPRHYGQQPIPECGPADEDLDRMERMLFDWALKRDVPILAVCRGIQYLNVYLGGTLYQDLPVQNPSDVNHSQQPPYHVPVHAVTVEEGSFLANLTGAGELMVNSFHHQAVHQVAPGLTVDALSPDGIVEAVHMEGKPFVLGLQWHPEFFPEEPWAQGIFNGFIRACNNWQNK